MTFNEQSPDHIAHVLVTNVGSPVRIYLKDGTLTVLLEPYRSGTPTTTDVPIESFDAVLEDAEIVDGGLNLFGINGLHLPASEWERVGLSKHWEADDADLGSPFFPPERKLEIWASREDAFYDTPPEQYQFDHLESIPEDSPVRTEWAAHSPDDEPNEPPVPLSTPSLYVYAVRADGVTQTHGFDRIEAGQIAAVEILDEIYEQPREPDIESRTVDLSPPPRHPDVDYEEIEPLPQEPSLLEAVHTINRHAKRLDSEADSAYHANNGAAARAYSIQKKALYKTKTVAVHRLAKANPEATRLAVHDLNGEHEMYCLSFPGGYAFHQPLDAVEDALLADVRGESSIDVESEEIEFTATADTDDLEMTLADALLTLLEQGLNANAYLDATSVTDYDWEYDISTTFECLPGVSE